MKILIIGQFGGVHLGSTFAAAFRSLGHTVQEIDPIALSGRAGTSLAAERAGRLIGQLARAGIAELVLRSARRADLVFVLKGFLLPPSLWSRLRRKTGALIVNFNPDNPFVLNGSSSADYLVASIPEFDSYLVWSRELVVQVERAGARRAEFMAFATDPANFYPVEVSAADRRTFGSSLCFVGNHDEEREWWIAQICERGLRPCVWGSGWDRSRSKVVRSSAKHGLIGGETLRKVIAASDIHLNLLRKQNKSGHNMRTFEIPASGAFLLTERSPDLPLLFTEDEEVVAYSTPDELVQKVRRYEADPESRRRIAAAGHARAIQQTYLERAKQILRLVGSG